MGDNRNHSNDSRAFGYVPFDHVVGTVIFRFWPVTRFGTAGHYEHHVSIPDRVPRDVSQIATDSLTCDGR